MNTDMAYSQNNDGNYKPYYLAVYAKQKEGYNRQSCAGYGNAAKAAVKIT